MESMGRAAGTKCSQDYLPHGGHCASLRTRRYRWAGKVGNDCSFAANEAGPRGTGRWRAAAAHYIIACSSHPVPHNGH
ncbi:hypothetical protein BaRGS_00007011 [Batillaria attramentaria]|uniref:Uncharacterized protein n=1 Tax=Batillaria attramentaria TaxID=370345 RepID=A0ABD0LQ20_9CAEN